MTGYIHAGFVYKITDGTLTCFSITYRDWQKLP